MPEQGAFRQVDEKHVSAEVELLVWSPKFDLVALSNVQGEVVLHRLCWQKVWSLPALSEDIKVTALSWRPDGKVLAVGYSSGQVNLCFIENAEVLHTLEVDSYVTCLKWVCQAVPPGQTWSCDPYVEDNSDLYLPRLQPLNKSYGSLSKGNVEENVEDRKKLKGQKELNILIIGSRSTELQLYIYGVFPVAKVTLTDPGVSEPIEVRSALLSEDLRSLVVLVQAGRVEDMDFSLITFDTSLLACRDKELHLFTMKYGQISTLIGYLQATILQMQEAWEDILLEMDSKLYNFAQQKQASGEGTVSNDFLELLLFGTPSTELQTFLMNELTDKGLKKLGHSIETSYSNIQKLVVKHLQSVSQALLYHISELQGMSKCFERFWVLGIDQKTLHRAVMTAGSFVLKTSELQQVIDGSIKNFKAFFRWLYVVILRLSDEKPPPELSKMTQHDVNFVADFLRDNFAQFTPREEAESIEDLRSVSPTDKKGGFKLEKVGQYLKNENLSNPPDISGNPWIQFCRASYSLKDSTVLYPVESNKSLIQLQETLEKDAYTTLHKPAVTIGKSMEAMLSLFLFSHHGRDEDTKPFVPKIAQFTVGSPPLLYTVFTTDPTPCEKLYILTQPTNSHSVQGNIRITSVRFSSLGRFSPDSSTSSERCEHHCILDVSYYDDAHMSLLLQEDTEEQVPVLLQLPVSLIQQAPSTALTHTGDITANTDIPLVDLGPDIEASQFRRLVNMRAHSFAVSGTRHTATVLFSSRRRVRIFLMDAEEEDDDEEDDDDMDGADISNQSEIDQSVSGNDLSQSGQSVQETSQSESMVLTDSGTDGMEDGQEDKENTSQASSSGDQSGPS